MWVYVNKVLRPQVSMWQSQINLNCKIDSIICAPFRTRDVIRFQLLLIAPTKSIELLMKSIGLNCFTPSHNCKMFRESTCCCQRVCDMNGMLIDLIAHAYSTPCNSTIDHFSHTNKITIKICGALEMEEYRQVYKLQRIDV